MNSAAATTTHSQAENGLPTSNSTPTTPNLNRLRTLTCTYIALLNLIHQFRRNTQRTYIILVSEGITHKTDDEEPLIFNEGKIS